MDDTLNNFTETLQSSCFFYSDSYGLPKEKFEKYIAMIQEKVSCEDDLLSTEYASLRYKIHEQCYRSSQARADGVEFMQWLKKNNWTIAICTFRDLRRAAACTRAWLADNNIPFDYLFYSQNKVVFCNLWGIRHLVDDDDYNIEHGKRCGVNVYYPIKENHQYDVRTAAKGFVTFEEVKQWIKE